MNDKFYHLLGMCRRAGKLVAGQDSCSRIINSGKAQLIIMSTKSSANAQKKFSDMCRYREIDIIMVEDKESFGNKIGKPENTIIAITDLNFKKAIVNILENLNKDMGEING